MPGKYRRVKTANTYVFFFFFFVFLRGGGNNCIHHVEKSTTEERPQTHTYTKSLKSLVLEAHRDS
jgi:hypothetical protein